MKKNTIALGILAGLFLIASIVMTILFSQEKSANNALSKFGVSLVESFSNAVDYSLCNIDRELGNVDYSRCDDYLSTFGNDIETLKKEFGMQTHYKYIGK